MIYASKVIGIQYYHGNSIIIHSNHINGTQPNKNLKVFKKHRVNLLLFFYLCPKPVKREWPASTFGMVIKRYLLQAWITCKISMRLKAKNIGEMFTINGFSGKKVTFFKIIIVITSKLVGGFFFLTKSNIMYQIFSRSDASKKKVGTQLLKK